MPISPELQSKITLWRTKSKDGTITLAEMKEAVLLLRQGRRAAADASAASKSKSTKKPARSAEDMLADF